MKHSKFLQSKLTVGLFFFIAVIGLTSMQTATTTNPVGVWEYEVEIGESTLEGEITITKTDGELAISIATSTYGTLELEDIVLSGNDLTANVEIESNTIDFEFKFDGDSMSGTVTTPDGELEITAERRKE